MGPVDWDLLVLGPCQDVFGEPARWQSGPSGDWIDITGIYDEGFRPVDLIGVEDGMTPSHISSSAPMLGIRTSQFVRLPEQSDLIEIRGKTYRVREVKPDSHGGARIELNDASGEGNALPKYPEGFGCRSS
ncbi:head-tail joining protein [Gluconobacter cerinus]|uniref:head-tail joining protein n=1 Tax=Gluconobacter cerinus TaxID=38307 RepID=UPI001B8C5AE0|nr:hypothetical protein [Gluconobacter cerinus]MBS1067255.1 hypothetical protein [Gluconobacter cerinus]